VGMGNRPERGMREGFGAGLRRLGVEPNPALNIGPRSIKKL